MEDNQEKAFIHVCDWFRGHRSLYNIELAAPEEIVKINCIVGTVVMQNLTF